MSFKWRAYTQSIQPHNSWLVGLPDKSRKAGFCRHDFGNDKTIAVALRYSAGC